MMSLIYKYTADSDQGGRPYMEDVMCVEQHLTSNIHHPCRRKPQCSSTCYFGMFDGHGGSSAATFARKHLLEEMMKEEEFWSENDSEVMRAIQAGFLSTHTLMSSQVDNWPRTATGRTCTSGTTASVVILRGDRLYVAHVGDSSVVLAQQNLSPPLITVCLTKDHKPDDADERRRIEQSGGRVQIKAGVARVVWSRPKLIRTVSSVSTDTQLIDHVPFLAIARSLGDFWSYNIESDSYVVSPVPDVRVVRIDTLIHKHVIIASDGLWNVVSPSQAVQALYHLSHQNCHNSKPVSKASVLVQLALDRWSARKLRADNISVIVISFTHSLQMNHDSSHMIHDSSHLSHDSSLLSHDSSHLSHDSSHLSHDSSLLNHGSSHLSHDSSHLSHDSNHMSHDSSHLSHESSHMSHDSSHLSHESSYMSPHAVTDSSHMSPHSVALLPTVDLLSADESIEECSYECLAGSTARDHTLHVRMNGSVKDIGDISDDIALVSQLMTDTRKPSCSAHHVISLSDDVDMDTSHMLDESFSSHHINTTLSHDNNNKPQVNDCTDTSRDSADSNNSVDHVRTEEIKYNNENCGVMKKSPHLSQQFSLPLRESQNSNQHPLALTSLISSPMLSYSSVVTSGERSDDGLMLEVQQAARASRSSSGFSSCRQGAIRRRFSTGAKQNKPVERERFRIPVTPEQRREYCSRRSSFGGIRMQYRLE